MNLDLSTTEIIVLLGGLGLGYLVVSMLMGRGKAAAPGGVTLDKKTAPEPAWHEVLELPSAQASLDDISTAYRRLVSQYHPDKVATLGPELQALAVRKTVQINGAYQEALRTRGAGA
jgi:DnaJ-domain-containing protein 1